MTRLAGEKQKEKGGVAFYRQVIPNGITREIVRAVAGYRQVIPKGITAGRWARRLARESLRGRRKAADISDAVRFRSEETACKSR